MSTANSNKNIINYQQLADSMIINPDKIPALRSIVTNKILPGKAEYDKVEAAIKVPWWIVSLLHYRESTCNFKAHLHNGDPLTGRTVHVPAGRPKSDPEAGKGKPYSFHESAIDALTIEGFDKVREWTLPVTLERIEMYNGTGYQDYHPDMLSPYLWSWSNHYVKGKYASDGKFDANLVDQQAGCVPLLWILSEECIRQEIKM